MAENAGENPTPDNADIMDGPMRPSLQACVRTAIVELPDRCDCGRRMIVAPITKRPWCPTCGRYA
jgi:hypothetical protein